MELLSSKYLQSIAAVFLIYLTVQHTVEGISCYQCNSGVGYNGTDCETLPADKADLFKMNCINDSLFTYTRCRKTVQVVLEDTRIIRSCATAGTPSTTGSATGTVAKCIDRIGTSSVKVKYCECYTDDCNTSSGFFASVLLVVATALSNVLANVVKTDVL